MPTNSRYAGAVPLAFLADRSIIQAFLPMPLKPIKSESAQRYLLPEITAIN